MHPIAEAMELYAIDDGKGEFGTIRHKKLVEQQCSCCGHWFRKTGKKKYCSPCSWVKNREAAEASLNRRRDHE